MDRAWKGGTLRKAILIFATVAILSIVCRVHAVPPEPGRPKIIGRSEWGALAPRCPYKENPYIDAVTIHHTATSNDYIDSWEVVRAIQRYHMRERGWCDIGYHFLIDREGRIFEGRPMEAVGAHVRGHNVGNIGISLIGNFEERSPTDAELGSLIKLVSWIVKRYDVPLSNIRGHKDYSDTLCPGRHLYGRLPYIRRAVASMAYGIPGEFGLAAWWGMYSEYWSSDEETWERQVDDALKRLSESGIKTVFFLAKDPWGYAYYKSDVLPRNPRYSWDPLAYITKKARDYGISVHVYINVLSEGEREPNSYLNDHPGWAVEDSQGRITGWVDPRAEEHISRMVAIIEEILDNYDVDGIQLDRIRLPGDAGRIPLSEAEFYRRYGMRPSEDVEKWNAFIRESITDIVRRIRDAIKKKNKDLRLSAAVIPDPDRARLVFGQDWPAWIKRGYVDFAVIMSYTSSLAKFTETLAKAVEASGNARPVYAGIGAYIPGLSADDLQNQVSEAYKREGIYGVALFNVDHLLMDREKLSAVKDAIAKGFTTGEGETGPLFLLSSLLGVVAGVLALLYYIGRRKGDRGDVDKR